MRSIPLGTQTFSKSKTQFPLEVSPYFVTHGKGSRVWDVDGNEYIDFINSLAAITLGYGDPDVDAAVREQLGHGVIFSLPHPLEIEVAEKMIELVPCAEQVRFGKNGSDATAGAIRIARAFTGRDHVAVCGYHGWQDWYIGATARNLGVPESTRRMTHAFTHNDAGSLANLFRTLPDQIAAVILEPMNIVEPNQGFLNEVKSLTEENGAVLVFDETVTGFRLAKGGAQEYFGVTPDLATFGKGLANGYPISAVAGKASIMRLMEEVFFSFTFGGEALSLAAALATMTKLERYPVIETLTSRGERLKREVRAIIDRHELGGIFTISGHPSWTFLLIADAGGYSQWQIKTLYLQEMLSRGILILGTHNLSYAHSEADLDTLLSVYDEVLPAIGRAVSARTLERELRCKPLEPLFKIR